MEASFQPLSAFITKKTRKKKILLTCVRTFIWRNSKFLAKSSGRYRSRSLSELHRKWLDCWLSLLLWDYFLRKLPWWMASSWNWKAGGSTLFLYMRTILRNQAPHRLAHSLLLSHLHSLASWRFSKKSVKMRVTKMPIQDCKQKRHCYSLWPLAEFMSKFLHYFCTIFYSILGM